MTMSGARTVKLILAMAAALTAAACGSRHLIAALIGMLPAVCPRRGEETVERFVEDRAVGFVLD